MSPSVDLEASPRLFDESTTTRSLVPKSLSWTLRSPLRTKKAFLLSVPCIISFRPFSNWSKGLDGHRNNILRDYFNHQNRGILKPWRNLVVLISSIIIFMSCSLLFSIIWHLSTLMSGLLSVNTYCTRKHGVALPSLANSMLLEKKKTNTQYMNCEEQGTKLAHRTGIIWHGPLNQPPYF